MSYQAGVLEHALESTGKRMRPAVTLLAGNFNPHDDHLTETMAAAVELLHIASLLHDDTVDDSNLRRGKATVSSTWGRNAAVVAGDYIFAKSATLVCDTGNIRVVRRFAETIMDLSTGQFHEMADYHQSSLSRERYMKRIYNKTASLFTTAGESGAVLSNAPELIVRNLREYGYNIGMAFQIIDDVLDFEASSEELGKPVGNDLAHGILTLPALFAIEQQQPNNPVLQWIGNPDDSEALPKAVEFVQGTSAIENARLVAKEFGSKALAALKNLDANTSKHSLEKIVHYVLDRRN
ncbi:polyprenyl synthetase family protein [Dehalococcoidia bacterium]|nr:polyprenyl synthetase family protein [Dehalococcoidia bacterium]